MSDICYGMAPLIAAVDMVRYLFVKFVAGAGDVDEVELLDGAVATDFAWGILQTDVLAGENPNVETRPGRVSRIVAGAAFAAGTPLTAGTGAFEGHAIAGTPGVDIIHAIALEAAGAAGEIVRVITKFEVSA